jgi:hypothetical protein
MLFRQVDLDSSRSGDDGRGNPVLGNRLPGMVGELVGMYRRADLETSKSVRIAAGDCYAITAFAIINNEKDSYGDFKRCC